MKHKKSLGQNFLYDQNILNNIVNAGEVSEDDIILEIGPGSGNLTEKILLKKPKKLIVVEKDGELSKRLQNKFKNNIEVINKDILECFNDFKFNRPIKVFGNLPYNVSTKILISFIKTENFYESYKKFVFVFQKEVADRIVANENSKNYGRISVFTAWKTERLKILDISPECFYPKPKVWSSLISLSPKPKIEILKKAKNLEHITNTFFHNRRKMIKKPMKLLFEDYENIAKKINLDLDLRPQNLPKEKYFQICKIYENLS